jgi:hypothetical protein
VRDPDTSGRAQQDVESAEQMCTPRRSYAATRTLCAVALSATLGACAGTSPPVDVSATTPEGSGTRSALLFRPDRHAGAAERQRVVHERQRLWYARRDALLGVR